MEDGRCGEVDRWRGGEGRLEGMKVEGMKEEEEEEKDFSPGATGLSLADKLRWGLHLR